MAQTCAAAVVVNLAVVAVAVAIAVALDFPHLAIRFASCHILPFV